METVPSTPWKVLLAIVRRFWNEHKNVRRTVGVLCILIGLVALLTPLTPGSWLIPIGFEILGFRLLLWERIKTKIMRINNVLKLIIAIVVSEMAGVIGAVFTTQAIPMWYAGLAKPALNPPSWVFGPVWGTLYLLMGVALWLVWRSDSPAKGKAMWLFAAQLALNAIWSPIFFGAQSPGNAMAIIVLLWSAIVLTILVFRNISKAAAWLLVPYILWVTFAGYLNYSIWMLNVGRSSAPEPVFCTMDAKLCPDGSYVGRTGPNCEFTACP